MRTTTTDERVLKAAPPKKAITNGLIWRAKGLLQKVLSNVPGGTSINDCLQLTVGGLRDFEGNVDTKVVNDWLVLLSHMRELQISPRGLDFLEVGTGWYPTSPICFYLAGARSCRTFDLNRHLSERLTFRMLRRLEKHLPAIASASSRPLDELVGSYQDLQRSSNLAELLQKARIDYLAPADATKTGLPAKTVDVVFSNSVLEHVPPEIILRIMQESRRVLRPRGVAIHSANCGDHYAYVDSTITMINYLGYSNRRWRFWDNRLMYQNRLRPQDFVELAEQAGLQIVLYRYKPRPELLATLPQMRIAEEFKKYSPEQLCSTSVDFVARCSVSESGG